MNLFDISGKTIVISGSSRGLGKAIAGCFGSLGAQVVISSHEVDELHETRKEFETLGYDVFAEPADVRSAEDTQSLVENAVRHFGKIDVMICNAGTDIIKPAETYEIEEWEHVLSINVRGYYLCAKAAAQHMLPQRRGSIVMTSSIAGALGVPGLTPYAVSKGGVNQLVRTLAVEWADRNVRVNAVAPGYINNFMKGVHVDLDTPYQRRAMAHTPMGRRGELSEYFGPYVFLASEAASFVTGEILYVDGGYHAT
ncbi:SDR family NAD(P)-dependent oxidoreductase [Rhizobium panacihumi]|uniref:SDR family NAD(P)-dependent oxidoreductase n=1 Tax=Rhizobium panacihumi TaxID=2008450 RepID=UPI003D7A1C93